jgi:hypothetical protein
METNTNIPMTMNQKRSKVLWDTYDEINKQDTEKESISL